MVSSELFFGLLPLHCILIIGRREVNLIYSQPEWGMCYSAGKSLSSSSASSAIESTSSEITASTGLSASTDGHYAANEQTCQRSEFNNDWLIRGECGPTPDFCGDSE